MTALVIAIVAAVVLLVVVIVTARRRSRQHDGVATFQRQIDALSPEARRPVVDKVQQLEGGIDPGLRPRRGPDAPPTGNRPSGS